MLTVHNSESFLFESVEGYGVRHVTCLHMPGKSYAVDADHMREPVSKKHPSKGALEDAEPNDDLNI